ncbi:ATP-NAD kinase-like domain-containing protein [Rhexocercosporidium sp. MPI-PUGE-AT-0058]|nr:ATP-NAD kinase-like domain-containing protein [Rhexocercosporidium sp. MPI-PUGE-AT-0058]
MATTTILPAQSTEALAITCNDPACANPEDQAPADFTYKDGALNWDSNEIRDEDVITVINTLGGTAEYTIFSLEPEKAAEKEKAVETEEKIESKDDGETATKSPFKLRTTNAMILPQEFLARFQFQGLPPYLQNAKDVYVLISTLSGTGLAVAFFDEILHPLLRAISFEDAKYTVIKTKTAESVKEFTQFKLIDGANEGKEQVVMILSGDGGIVDTINKLLQGKERPSTYAKPTFVQLPFGTGNALFHSIHKPSPLPSIYIQGLRTVLHGTPKALPIFKATFSPGARLLSNEGQTATPLPNNTVYGAVVASHGLHSTLVADSDTTEYRKHGDKRFGLVANDLLFPKDGAPHKYKTDVTLFQGSKEVLLDRKEHGYVLATLVSNLEKTFTISPESKPFEAALRVVHFGTLNGDDAMAVMMAAYDNGRHLKNQDVGYEKVDGIKIVFREEGEDWKWRRCCIDGSIVGVEEGGWMEVRVLGEGEEAINVVAD